MLEQLRKSWAIKEKRTSLEELIKKRDEFNERVNQLREALDEATAKEDIDKINEDISALEAEKGETDYDAEVDKLNGEIDKVEKLLGGYLRCPALEDLDSYIVPVSLNDNQGAMGAIKLAMEELERESR